MCTLSELKERTMVLTQEAKVAPRKVETDIDVHYLVISVLVVMLLLLAAWMAV